MQNIVVVGIGEYYSQIVGPSLQKLADEGLIDLIGAVDIKPENEVKNNFFGQVEYRQRVESQSLSDLLADLKELQPIILLGHINELHISDAKDLLENGFKVALEKPYCLNEEQLSTLKKLLVDYAGSIVLLEYYLMMKSAPLLILADKIKQNSYYFSKKGLLEKYKEIDHLDQVINQISGLLENKLGKPKFVKIELLEGEGNTGRVDQRGPHFSDIRKGGGMILDIGLHAAVSLFAIQDYLGNIDLKFENGNVQIAKCKEYVEMAKEKFGLENKNIAESYAEIKFKTEESIPVKLSVGKYVLPNKNRRHITIFGEKGKIVMDLSDCELFFEDNQGIKKNIAIIPKKLESKYYPVIRSAIEILQNKSPFNFDLNKIALQAQEFILNVRKRAYQANNKDVFYKAGIESEEIF